MNFFYAEGGGGPIRFIDVVRYMLVDGVMALHTFSLLRNGGHTKTSKSKQSSGEITDDSRREYTALSIPSPRFVYKQFLVFPSNERTE